MVYRLTNPNALTRQTKTCFLVGGKSKANCTQHYIPADQHVINIHLKRFNYSKSGQLRQIFTLAINTHLKHVACKHPWLDFEGKGLFLWLHKNTMSVYFYISELIWCQKAWDSYTEALFLFFPKLILVPLFLLPFPANKHFQQQSERLEKSERLSVGQIKPWCQTKSLTKVFFSPQSTMMSNVLHCSNVALFFF